MKRYICPVCEHELTAKSYCPECKKVIKKPWVYDGYMPNEYTGNFLQGHSEKHDGACIEPNKARNCETREEKRQDRQFSSTQSDQTVYKRYEGGTSSAPGSQIWKNSSSGSTYSARTYSPSSSRSKKTGKVAGGCGCGCLVVVIGFILLVAGIISSLEMNMDEWLEIFEDMNVEVNLGEGFLEDEWEEVEYSEIIAAGVRCNGYDHYAVKGKALYDTLSDVMVNKIGLTVTGSSEYQENGIYHDSEYGDVTYYDYYRYKDWKDGYFGVVSDTVTDEVHYVTVYGYNPKEMISLGMTALEEMESVDVSGMRKLLEDALSREDITDGKIYTIGDSSVWFCKYSEDNDYILEISVFAE